ncbi:MAG: hypothetical protein ACLTCB_07505 [Merdibacter sp.]
MPRDPMCFRSSSMQRRATGCAGHRDVPSGSKGCGRDAPLRPRAPTYEFYTDRKWGSVTNYSMMINTSCMGIDQCVRYLHAVVMEMQKEAAAG